MKIFLVTCTNDFDPDDVFTGACSSEEFVLRNLTWIIHDSPLGMDEDDLPNLDTIEEAIELLRTVDRNVRVVEVELDGDWV